MVMCWDGGRFWVRQRGRKIKEMRMRNECACRFRKSEANA